MDPWEMFSELCRRVVEDQNVVLEVIIANGGFLLKLSPIADDSNYEEEDNE